MYATLKDVEKEQADGTEERRAAQREDQRKKIGLFPIKRLGGVHIWLLKLFENPIENFIRIERMKKPRVSMGIITDACPKVWGAILVKVQDTSPRVPFPVEAVEGMISENEAQLLKVEYGEASSQAVMEVMEALAIVRAVEKWGHKMRERAVLIRSDSSVALSMTKRQSSPHPSLNFLAAELTLRLEKYQVQRITLHHIMSRLHEREGKPKPPRPGRRALDACSAVESQQLLA